jgi:branched-chain amino acid transport system ATP-binding protein
MTRPILEVDDLVKRFGGLTATDEVSVSFDDDELCAIIGPNGAGKSTFFNLIMGELRPTSGTVRFDGEDITDLQPAGTVRRGLVKSFQTSNVFDDLTVFENVRLASQASGNPYNFWRRKETFEGPLRKAETVLDEMDLAGKRDATAAELSHGEERSLEIAIALATDPKMLLLDEPSSGMSPEETREVIDVIRDLSTTIPVLLIEHKMSVVMGVADRIIVLHNGQVLADGTPETIRNDEQVREVYLGGG